jgi:hypothetical protein
MADADERNLLYFEGNSVRNLYDQLDEWQRLNQRRLYSVSVLQEGHGYSAIALAHPLEVVITSASGKRHATVSENGRLFVFASEYS